MASRDDERWMRATLRMARRNMGLTGTNPSVGTMIVADGTLVGCGVTAPGGRPHAEPIALAMAGKAARGATAYVTLEPCAHHGATPPCAEALIAAGVSRVVTAYVDPDRRVDGEGHAMLRAAGIEVEEGLCSAQAARDLAGYLMRQTKQRPHVTLKLAVSADGYLGREGERVAITGDAVRDEVHAMRARSDAILVGAGTARVDDPELTCRLPGLEDRSPTRFVLDARAELDPASKLARSGSTIVSASDLAPDLVRCGARHLRAETVDGRVALPEMLNDMAATGISTLMVEGGAAVARSFLHADLVDRIVVFRSPDALDGGIVSPLASVPDGFVKLLEDRFGPDTRTIWERPCSPAS